jgi:hypothetical protein
MESLLELEIGPECTHLIIFLVLALIKYQGILIEVIGENYLLIKKL